MIPLVAAVPLPLIDVASRTSPPEQTIVDLTVHLGQPEAPFIDAAPYGPPRYVQSWDDYIGQEAVKRELQVYIDEAVATCGVMPHVLLASGVPGVGKGHDVDTLLLTPTGWRRLGDLSVGDAVIGSNGQATEITAIYDRGTLPLYRVTFSDGSSVRCDGEHLWTVQTPKMRSRGTWTTIDTGTLISRSLKTRFGHSRYYIPMTAPVEHFKRDLPVEPYLAGVMLGNADFAKGVISLNTQDRDIAERLVARQQTWWQNSTFDVDWLSEYPTTTALRFRPTKANAIIRLLGQPNIAAKDKFIPAAYLTSHVEFRRELLAGLLDTDGSVRSERGSAQFHTTSLSLANGVQTLVESLGGTARVRVLSRGEIRVEINILENPFRSQRKAALWKPSSRKPSRSIVSIIPDSEGVVRCIRVAAEDSLYVTERYIVTHNTTLARLVADELGVRCVMLVPPFSAAALHQAALGMNDGEVLFIDEIHKLADQGPRAAENLLHLMEEGVLYLDDGVHPLAEFCLMGATTDPGKLPETIVDRFVVKPYFDAYTAEHMVRIVKNFCNYYCFQLPPETMVAIAKASRGTPRVARELVRAAKALQTATGEAVRPEQLLEFKRFEPDGTMPQHRAYLTALYTLFGRDGKRGREFIAGEAALMSLLRESKTGLARLERFLLERGLIDRTPRGRRLTERGVLAAYNYARA